MEPHFAAPVPPDMPLMVKWSALPFTTPGNVELRRRDTFCGVWKKRKGRKCNKWRLTCPNLKRKYKTRLYPSKVTLRLETSHEFLQFDNNMIVGLLKDPSGLQFSMAFSPHPGRGHTWGDNPNADTCHQLHRDARRGVGVLQVLHVGRFTGREPLPWEP